MNRRAALGASFLNTSTALSPTVDTVEPKTVPQGHGGADAPVVLRIAGLPGFRLPTMRSRGV